MSWAFFSFILDFTDSLYSWLHRSAFALIIQGNKQPDSLSGLQQVSLSCSHCTSGPRVFVPGGGSSSANAQVRARLEQESRPVWGVRFWWCARRLVGLPVSESFRSQLVWCHLRHWPNQVSGQAPDWDGEPDPSPREDEKKKFKQYNIWKWPTFIFPLTVF